MKDRNGFTLIELLAVITIMGVLMIVAIPAVTRVIENSRKDTFINTVQNYVSSLKTWWASDNLYCKDFQSSEYFYSSSVSSGFYFVEIDTASKTVTQLLESGGKSPWGSRHIKGYILVHVYDDSKVGPDGSEIITRKIDYYPVLSDGIHGVNATTSGQRLDPYSGLKKSENLKRGNLQMTGITYQMAGFASNGKGIPKAKFPQAWDFTTKKVYDTPVYAKVCVEG